MALHCIPGRFYRPLTSMEPQIILAVDNGGNFLKYIPKDEGHKGEGIHHLAVTVFIFNSKGEVLLQKRKHKIFDSIWDNTASTHQLHLKVGKDESDEEATLRCLKTEWGIENVELKNLGGFNYFEKYNDICENEFCKLLIGNYDGEIKLNPQVGYGYRFVSKKDFYNEVEKNPQNFTPWCKEAVKILKEKGVL